MKIFAVALALLAPLAASAASLPQLICDPDARVTFQTSWIGTNSVMLSAEQKWQLPFRGHEPLTSGAQLSALARATDGPEELRSIESSASFLTFTPREQGAPTLYVASDLLTGSEQDGLVVTELRSAARSAPAASRFRVFHCRSR
jgi:hypothetical protein